jgi:hypothetical protein
MDCSSGSYGRGDAGATERFFRNAIRGGEERLMLAVLQDAVKCFQKYAFTFSAAETLFALASAKELLV